MLERPRSRDGPGGRFGAAAFVTGALDPVRDRQSFLALASPPTAATLLVYGPDTPRRSLVGMELLSELPGMERCRYNFGSLGIHEEHPGAVAHAVAGFLREERRNEVSGQARSVFRDCVRQQDVA